MMAKTARGRKISAKLKGRKCVRYKRTRKGKRCAKFSKKKTATRKRR